MNETLRVATPPTKPLMVYDGDCRFCVLWIKRWQQASGESVDYVPLQDPGVRKKFPELAPERLATAVHLIETNGAVFSGAEAAFRALANDPSKQRFLRWYQDSPTFATCSE